jgi:CBS domain-containing protein
MSRQVRPAGWRDISRRRVLTGSGDVSESASVFCPFEEKTVGLSSCRTCGFLDGLAKDREGTATAVFCGRDIGEREASVPDPGEAALAESSTQFDLRTPLLTAMTRAVTCVAPDVSIDTLRAMLLEDRRGAIPVVDAKGAVIGIVTQSDLLRDLDSFEGITREPPEWREKGFSTSELPRATAEDLMSRDVAVLPEEAPLSRAAAIMSFEDIQHIVVTSVTDGSVIGLLSATDIMRAMAIRAGYRLPPKHSRRSKK